MTEYPSAPLSFCISKQLKSINKTISTLNWGGCIVHVLLSFADWLDRPWFDSTSPLPSLWPVSVLLTGRMLQVLCSTDSDGCTVHIPCTQAENSTWHFLGAGSEVAAEMEHFRTDKQVWCFAHDVTKSRKPVGIKIPQNQTLPRSN